MILHRVLVLCLLPLPSIARAEDGSDLWLRYRPVEAEWQTRYAPRTVTIVSTNETATMKAARQELQRGLQGMLARETPVRSTVTGGTIVIGTPKSSREIGFDRTASGSNTVAQYAPEVARLYADIRTVPEDLLLWFHRVPWTHRMRSGRTFWDELIHRYDRGLRDVAESNRRNIRSNTI